MSEFACSDIELTADWERLSAADKDEINDALGEVVPSGTGRRAALKVVISSIHLFTNVLGIDFDGPGCALVNIAPNLDDLAWARGWVTIPQGIVKVSWQRVDRRFILDVVVPTGVHLRPILPAMHADDLLCDGEPVHQDSIVRRDDDEAELCVMPGATYHFEVISN